MLRLPLLLAFAMASVSGQSDITEPQCACTFEVPAEEEQNCVVYGQVTSGLLIDFERVSESCLAGLAITERVLEADTLFSICPNNNETDVSIQKFINFIRDSNSTTANAIKGHPDFTQFFQTNEDGSVDIADEITTSLGVKYNCSTGVNLCWNEIKNYFNTQKYRAGLVCEDLYAQQTTAMQSEQSLARSAICQADEADIPEACVELQEKLQNFMAGNPELQCSDLETRAAASQLPNRESCNSEARVVGEDDSGAVWVTGWVGTVSWVALVGLLSLY
jgi:hypothetical protein